MSADNTVIVLATKRLDGRGLEYRVVETQNAEDLTFPADYPSENPVYNHYALFDRFKDCKVFLDEEGAYTEAERLEEKAGFVEYGICLFDENPEVSFPTEAGPTPDYILNAIVLD
jgi:hypothetical protein